MSRILIVEDEHAIAVALDDDLRLEGYDTESARDGEAAIAAARRETFDLILLDVMLPKRDGFEVCRELRRSGVTCPILLLTARSQESDRVLGLDMGADDYVTKPYSPKELRARIRALLRRAAARADSNSRDVVRFGDCEIDFARGELRLAGKPIPTTPLELKLMGVFARRPGRVLSRRVLIDEVWGEHTTITERVVDNQIANLRKKIEPAPQEPRYLKSIRGLGYRFDPENVTNS